MRKILLTGCCIIACVLSSFAQLANWQPVAAGTKFPTNLVGQINGYARICQMKFHVSDPNKMYAITAEGGLFITSDAGSNWTVAPGTDKITSSCASVCVDYTNDQTIWVGTGDPNYYNNGAGLYKSTDGGANFSATTLTNCLVLHILQNPTNASEYVAATNKGIYKSTDGGATWIAKTSTALQFTDLVANAATNSQVLYACTKENAPQFFRSTDYGNTWTAITTGITAPTTFITSGARIAVTPADPNVVYFETIGGGGMLHKSNDGGLSFTVKKPEGSPYITFYDNLSTSSTQGNYNNCIWVDKANPAKIWLQSHNTWLSTDSGVTWTMLTFWSSVVHTDMHQVCQSPYDNSKLYSCNDGGVWLSTDGGNTWTPKSDGIYAFEIASNTGVSSFTRKDFVSIGTQDNARLYGNSTGWYTISGGDDYAKRQFDYNGNIYIDGIQRQLNHTGSRTNYNLPTLNWNAFGFNRRNADLAFMGYKDSIYRSVNVSAASPTWTSIQVLSPATLTVRDVHSCIADPNRLYVLLTNGNIAVSTNALAASPTFTIYTIPGTASSTGSVVAMANNADIVYVAENNKVYRSANGGVTWTDVTSNLPNVSHRRILAEAYGGTEELVFVATNNAVYYKKAGQSSWTNYSSNLPGRRSPTEFSMYDDSTANGRIRYASYGRAMWETPFTNLRTTSANFTYDNSSNYCTAGRSATFSDISLGNIVSRTWTFAGGTPATSTVQNPAVSFATPGAHMVALTISDGSNTSSVSDTIFVIDNIATYAGCTVASNSNLSNGFGIGISRFILGSIDNTTSHNDGSYNNYSCSVSTALELNTTYTMSITTGTANAEGARVYIDYNNNGIFEAGESIATFAAVNTGSRSVTFTTPSSGVTMNRALRLRVLSRFNAIPSAGNACDVSTYGQAEDYTVYFASFTAPSVSCSSTGNTSCSTPNGAASATAANVTYLWNTGSTASSISGLTAGNYTVTVTDISSGLTAVCNTTVAANINLPSVPVLSASANTICSGTSVTLTILSGSLNEATNWYWYTGSCGGTPAGTGTSITVSPTGTTTYYVRGEGSCFTPGTCGNITITVNNNPASAVISGSSSVCAGNPANISVAVTGGASPYTVVYSAGTVNNYTSGTPIPVLPVNATTYTLVSVTDANGCAASSVSGSAAITISNNTFTGSGNWTDNARWTCGAPPSPADVFNIGSNASAVLNTNFIIAGTMNMQTGSTLEVAPGNTITVSGTANLGGQSVVFKSTATGYGSLGPVTGTINGSNNVTVERYIPNNGFRSWRLLSIPVSGTQTINAAWQEGNAPGGNIKPDYGTLITGPIGGNGLDGISSTASMLQWNGTGWTGVTGTNIPISSLSPYKAFYLYVRGERTKGVTGATTNSSATTLRTKGNIYTGDQLIQVPANSFTLVPNLYPSAIDFTLMPRSGGAKDIFYVWDSKKQNGSSLGVYQTFSATNAYQCLIGGGSYTLGTANTLIESGQAFFTEGGASSGTITLKESSKINSSGGSLGLRPSAGALKRISTRLILNNEAIDASVVVFNGSFANGNGNEDALKYHNPGENLALDNNGYIYSVEGRRSLSENDILQFRMWNLAQQSYSLEIVPENLHTAALSAVLEDKYLNTLTPVSLESNSIIPFTVDANEGSKAPGRFRLLFAKQKAAVLTAAGFKIIPNPVTGRIFNLRFISQPAGKYIVRIFTTNKQVVSENTIPHAGGTAEKTVTLPAALSNGQYEIEITAPDKRKTVLTMILGNRTP